MKVLDQVVVVSLGVIACGCASSPSEIMTPRGMGAVVWTPEEQKKDIAVQHLRRSDTASLHLVRLAGSEVPHVHEHSDLTITVLSGKVRMHLGNKTQVVRAGQVIDVPRGTPHHAENLAGTASEAFTLFSPPVREGDNLPVQE